MSNTDTLNMLKAFGVSTDGYVGKGITTRWSHDGVLSTMQKTPSFSRRYALSCDGGKARSEDIRRTPHYQMLEALGVGDVDERLLAIDELEEVSPYVRAQMARLSQQSAK